MVCLVCVVCVGWVGLVWVGLIVCDCRFCVVLLRVVLCWLIVVCCVGLRGLLCIVLFVRSSARSSVCCLC